MRIRSELGQFVAIPASCHPDKKHKGNGLCATCYSRESSRRSQPANRARSRAWYEANREKAIAAATEWHRNNRARSRAHVLKYIYGLTPEDEDALLLAQDFKCPICLGPFDPTSRGTKIAVDHDHKTGVVRGLLHVTCNVGMGMLRDDPERLERAAAYLRGRAEPSA